MLIFTEKCAIIKIRIIYSYLVFVWIGLMGGRFLCQSQNIPLQGYASATVSHAAAHKAM